MRVLKHLPMREWPDADVKAFEVAYVAGDIFDETTGVGSHLAAGSRKSITMAYRRWLGFLQSAFPEALERPPADRITTELVRAYIEHLETEVGATTVATNVQQLCYGARLVDPARDWGWLGSLSSRLAARGRPVDRVDRLVPPSRTLDLGLELMDGALASSSPDLAQRDLQYRDGLLIALLSLWPIRRRSLAALSVDRHLAFDDAGITIILHPADTKSKRSESFRVPPELLPYFRRHLGEIRPRLLAGRHHNGLWASNKRCSLSAGRIYDIVRARIRAKFGKDMGLHDFRRSAATFIAMDTPDKIGLIPGVLQHTSPDVGARHYNLAGSMKANERYNTMMSDLKTALRSKLRT